jgi:type IV pilus assembly protein PilV
MKMVKQTGASLVEVMVALFVLAIGLLGILAMQSKSMQFNQSAHIYSQAIYLANDMAERIRSNIDADARKNYAMAQMPAAASENCQTSACSGDQLVDWDKYTWSENVKRFLPGGTAKIEAQNATHYKISVRFDDSRAEGKEHGVDGFDGTKEYALVVEF